MIRLFFVVLFFISQVILTFSAQRTDPVLILSVLTDSAKLSTLGERGANPRINKAMYWLWYAQQQGISPKEVIDQALLVNHTPQVKATVVEESLLRNWSAANEWGLFLSTNNLQSLRRGGSAKVMKGLYQGEITEVDHMIPFAVAPEIGNEILNLEILPRTLNRQKSDYVGDVQLAYARRLLSLNLISQETFLKVQKARYEIAPPLLLPAFLEQILDGEDFDNIFNISELAGS
ncbi:MAG: hypothetical protein K1X66_00910 [Verrucomicrobiae bacterium]|nr:hypothetical protein [Verrucomicrobiae bacterium]